MSFRMMDLMVDVTPALCGARGCPNSGPGTGRKGCPNSGPPPTGDDFGCPNSGTPNQDPGCPNSGGPPTGDDLGCPDSGRPTHPGRKGCPNSGVTGRRKATGAFEAGLPDLRRQLREALGAQL